MMAEKRNADPVGAQPRVKRSRFEPINDAENGPSTDARPNPPVTQNGASAANKLQKARELLANKAALKAQIQALKVDHLRCGQQSTALQVASLMVCRSVPTIASGYKSTYCTPS